MATRAFQLGPTTAALCIAEAVGSIATVFGGSALTREQ